MSEKPEVHLAMFYVHPEKRREFEAIMLLFTRGLQEIEVGIDYGPVLKLDKTDDELIDGLAALHGNYDPKEHSAKMTAWNAARLLLGATPYQLPPHYDDPAHRTWDIDKYGDLPNRGGEWTAYGGKREKEVEFVA
jgi:hypothetical protein